jgi:hypothetical protein
MMFFSPVRFQRQVEKSLAVVKKLLQTTRNPQCADNVQHSYNDKFSLAEMLSNSAIASCFSLLETLGFTGAQIKQMITWSKERTVNLRFSSEEKCSYLRELKRKVEISSHKILFGLMKSSTTETIHEYFWKLDVDWKLQAYTGTGEAASDCLTACSRRTNTEVTTNAAHSAEKLPPSPELVVRPNVDVDVTWLLSMMDDTLSPCFSIDRLPSSCRTPRRNEDSERAVNAAKALGTWADTVKSYFKFTLFPRQEKNEIDMKTINDDAIFMPVLPLLEVQQPKAPPQAIALRPAPPKSLPPSNLLEPSPTAAIPPISTSASSSVQIASSSTPLKPRPPTSLSSAFSPFSIVRRIPSATGEEQDEIVIPPVSDVNEYLREQRRTLRAKLVTEMATS